MKTEQSFTINLCAHKTTKYRLRSWWFGEENDGARMVMEMIMMTVMVITIKMMAIVLNLLPLERFARLLGMVDC